VALSGSLDSFALPDVMRLLASTNKTGRLRVSGDRGSGSVWVEDGEIVASELTSPPTTDPTHAEVLFAMLRFSSGSFSFESDSRSVKATSPEQVEPILVSSEHMMVEWRAIEQVVPSLDVYVELAPDPGGGDVMVDAARWRCIAAVGGGSTVGQVGAKLEQGELEICRTVKELVELGLLVIGEAPVELEPEAIVAVAAPEPATIIAATPAPEPASADAPVADIEVPDTASESVVEEETGRVGLDAEIDAEIDAENDAENDADDEVAGGEAVEPGFDQVADEVADEFADQPEGAGADSVMVDAMTGEVAPADLSNEVEAPPASGDLLDSSFESGPMVTTTPGLAGLGAPVQSQIEPDDLTDPLIRSGVVDDLGSDPVPDLATDLATDLVTDGLVTGENGGGSSGGHEGGGLFGGATPAEVEAGPELDPAEMARQLANLSPKAAKAVAAAAKASTEAEREAALAAVEAEDDTVDRGLLLKFLGSVDT
jgi:hypothetical protein